MMVVHSICDMKATDPSILGGLGQPRSLGSSEGHLGQGLEVRLRNKEGNKENCTSSGPPSPSDPNHKPSYLKLSCAVSGYGKYSRYSTYQDVTRRSPFSSQSSLRSEPGSPDPAMPAEHRTVGESTEGGTSTVNGGSPAVVNGHARRSAQYPTGDTLKDGEYYLQHTHFEEDRIRGASARAEAYLRLHEVPEDVQGRIRSAIGKANLLATQKFGQFRDLCQNHMHPDPAERETKWGDLQGFWDMVKLQVDSVDAMFAEIELIKDNGWQELKQVTATGSRRSSASSSPTQGSVSQASTPSATPGHTPSSKRRTVKPATSAKDTPDSSPERTKKQRQAAKARDEARKAMLAERRAAMKQGAVKEATSEGVQIYMPPPPSK